MLCPLVDAEVKASKVLIHHLAGLNKPRGSAKPQRLLWPDSSSEPEVWVLKKQGRRLRGINTRYRLVIRPLLTGGIPLDNREPS